MEFQEWYEPIFNEFDAMAVSDVFIAKRVEYHPMEWAVIEAFKVNFGFNMKFAVKAIILEHVNDTQIGNSLYAIGDFAAIRRRHLDGIKVPCGLIVSAILPMCLI